MSHMPGSFRMDPEGDCSLSSLGISVEATTTGIGHTYALVVPTMMSSFDI